MPDHLRIIVPPARFRAEGELPDVALVERILDEPRLTYTTSPTAETCSLHRNEMLWFVEVSTGESALWCPVCTTSNFPARPYQAPAPSPRYTWRAFLRDLKELFQP